MAEAGREDHFGGFGRRPYATWPNRWPEQFAILIFPFDSACDRYLRVD
jgi:hypothetical protein